MSTKKPDRERVSSIAPFGLRMLPELRERVAEAAEENGRSMNSEIVARLQETFNSEDFKDEDQQERDDLWREIHRRDARIRQTETDSFERTKTLEQINSYLTNIILQKDQLIKAVCFAVIANNGRLPRDVENLAAGILKAFDADTLEKSTEDRMIAARLFGSNLRRYVELENVLSNVPQQRGKRAFEVEAPPSDQSDPESKTEWDWRNSQADAPSPIPKPKSGRAKQQKG